MNAQASPLLTMAEVAERCQVSQRTVRTWIVSGDLEALRFGWRTVRISEESLVAFLRTANDRQGAA